MASAPCSTAAVAKAMTAGLRLFDGRRGSRRGATTALPPRGPLAASDE
jgi:hypothetical protein